MVEVKVARDYGKGSRCAKLTLWQQYHVDKYISLFSFFLGQYELHFSFLPSNQRSTAVARPIYGYDSFSI